MTVRSFCEAQGINENRFYYWVKRLKESAVSAVESPKSFLPVSTQVMNRFTGKMEESESIAPASKMQNIKIAYPNGVVLQLETCQDIHLLKSLITLNSSSHV